MFFYPNYIIEKAQCQQKIGRRTADCKFGGSALAKKEFLVFDEKMRTEVKARNDRLSAEKAIKVAAVVVTYNRLDFA